MATPVTTPIPYTQAELDAVSYDATGLVPAIVQEAGTGDVLMVAWMNRDVARKDIVDRPLVVLEPEPPGVLVQGGDVGRPPIRARGALRLRHGRDLAQDRTRGPRRVPHRCAQLFLSSIRQWGQPGKV